MAEESKVQPVNKTYNTIESKVGVRRAKAIFGYSEYSGYYSVGEHELLLMMQVEAKRVPRRVLHFSDGVIEEFSTDDEAEREEEEKRQNEANQQV